MKQKVIKIKLPRKRKKAYIKNRGRNNYRGMCSVEARKLNDLEDTNKFPNEMEMVVGSYGYVDYVPCSWW